MGHEHRRLGCEFREPGSGHEQPVCILRPDKGMDRAIARLWASAVEISPRCRAVGAHPSALLRKHAAGEDEVPVDGDSILCLGGVQPFYIDRVCGAVPHSVSIETPQALRFSVDPLPVQEMWTMREWLWRSISSRVVWRQASGLNDAMGDGYRQARG